MIGDFGKNTCPDGSGFMDKSEDCQNAANHFGLSYQSSNSWATNPKGCSRDGSGKVYFNKHATGKANSLDAPICVKGMTKKINSISFSIIVQTNKLVTKNREMSNGIILSYWILCTRR